MNKKTNVEREINKMNKKTNVGREINKALSEGVSNNSRAVTVFMSGTNGTSKTEEAKQMFKAIWSNNGNKSGLIK